MTRNQFIGKFDVKNGRGLSEEKRKAPKPDKKIRMPPIKWPAWGIPVMTLRSGNANGSDKWVSASVAEVNEKCPQGISPLIGQRQTTNLTQETISLFPCENHTDEKLHTEP